MNARRLYLAGPIRGIRNYQQRFAQAAALLRYEGWDVFNPVEDDEVLRRHGIEGNIRLWLERDLGWICRWADVVALLPGWKKSAGAVAEERTARACGIACWELGLEYDFK
jgi:hypothetical protein